jgi:glutathione S-transferase
MSLTLHFHPLSSFCHKVLIALYENGTPFEPVPIDLGDPQQRARLEALWPLTRFPVLVDSARGLVLPESSIIIEHVALYYPGGFAPVPADPAQALEARLWDRIFDNHVMTPMQRIVFDRLRPDGAKDPHGVADARAILATALGVVESRMAGRRWAVAETFSLADCAAAPALFYADWVQPFRESHPQAAAYLDRLAARPSFARVIEEARPYRHFFPQP